MSTPSSESILKTKSSVLISEVASLQQTNMSAPNSISMRDQVMNVLKELQEILIKFLTLLITLITVTNTESGKLLFTEQHKLMMTLVLTIVLYFFFATIGTILHIYKGSLLPIIICVMLIVGSVVSVVALSFISITLAWITLVLWLGIFTLVAYDYGVPQRIKNWIKGPSHGAGLLPL